MNPTHTAESSMDFPAFIEWSRSLRATRADLLDLAETRIAHALADIRPAIAVPATFARLHRCHLAPVWCQLRGLPPAHARRAFACNGVRHGLELLLREFARAGRKIAMPRDVYPVYGRIAEAAGAATCGFVTFPVFDLPALLARATADGASAVLLPAPLKLHGRAWTPAEADAALAWLAADEDRRLVLDGVYAFGQPLEAPMQRLIATDQVFYLDSLSKGWLHELVFGIVLVPERDRPALQEIFRALQPSQRSLFLARELMTSFAAFPSQLARELARRRAVLERLLAEKGIAFRPALQGYLLAIEADAGALLAAHGVLVLPAAAFGSERQDFSMASALMASGASPPFLPT